jgi:lipopolysaccharide transport system ATP-binding protein
MSTAHIKLQNISLSFQIFGEGSRSLKKNLIAFGTGGWLGRDASNHLLVHAIQNLSLDLNEGDRLGILGANGAGKSTLLRILAGIYIPQSGMISASGRVSSIIDVGVGLEPYATGYENIRSRAVLMGIRRDAWPAFLERVQAISELGDYLSLPVHTYSSGMVLRLNFAISMCIQPDILILDEWLSVADEAFRAKAEQQMAALVDQSRIIVIASHNLELLKRVCNRAILLEKGGISFQGSVEEAVNAYRLSVPAV